MKIAVAGGSGVVGRYVAESAKAAGHAVVVLARSAGVDTRTGEGLAAALDGVAVIVDATNISSSDEREVADFFVTSTANLQRAGADAGVGHLVVLSIVGIDREPAGYYAAKLAHEDAALSGPVPATILRATQFHEFPARLVSRNRQGATAKLPNLRVQTVAARTVGEIVLREAQSAPAGRGADVAGPEEADLVVLARKFVERFGLGVEIVPVEPEQSRGALLPGEGSLFAGPSFDEWLAGDDALAPGRGR